MEKLNNKNQNATASIHVAVGIVVNTNQEILIAKRATNKHQGDLWEFPGGKVESGEDAYQALCRELQEEIGIVVQLAKPLTKINYTYPDKKVLLDVWLVTQYTGEPEGIEGQPIKWTTVAKLNQYKFPNANIAIITAIQSL